MIDIIISFWVIISGYLGVLGEDGNMYKEESIMYNPYRIIRDTRYYYSSDRHFYSNEHSKCVV